MLVLVSKDLTINILFSSKAAKIKLSKCCQACSGLTSEIQSTSVAFQLFLYARYTVLVLLPLVKLEILILINAMHVTFFFKVEEKFNTYAGISWNKAMDKVRIERLMTKHGKDTLLVIIRDWPAKTKYKDKPELVASLEYLVWMT